jgi:nitroreductase
MIIKEIVQRRSVREFKTTPVPDEIISEIINAAQFAPTARNNHSVEFIIIKKQATKEKIFKLAIPEQKFVKQAPILIVPVTNPAKTNQPVQDLSVASENVFLQATSLGLGSVWKNLKPAVANEIKKILGIPDDYLIINVIPLGYPKETPPPHTDEDFDEEKIHNEKW